MSSGTPALILKTTDGGLSWQEKYRNIDTAYFFDAMDFADKKHGYILGDPIKNKFLLLETKDGGETWTPFKNPPDALSGEAAFAASGTCLTANANDIEIVTGGSQSRQLILLEDKLSGGKWISAMIPITHGKSSQGAFSSSGLIVVGGDYLNNRRTDSVASYWPADEHARAPAVSASIPPAGFQSCVTYISGNTFLSTGTPGSNITSNSGKTWAQIDDASYNVCRKAKQGDLILLAGDHGKIGVFRPQHTGN